MPRASIALTGILGALPGAALGAVFVLVAGLLLFGATTSALTTEGEQAHRKAVELVPVARDWFAWSVVAATAGALLTSWLVVWLRFRKDPAGVLSAAAVAMGTIGGCLMLTWAELSLRRQGLLPLSVATVFAPFAGAFAGGYAATFFRRGALVTAGCFVAVPVLMALAYHLVRVGRV